ncbi:type II toxin-antitoxin system VapC family toxin [Thermococcus barophilus]|uniref:PIN domain-containing protein n=1 Tax=Thermococcus barophilus TaxID=55802 RepID=A0A0S1XCG8_THEBA|nr:type II toxin-antitoxin system VapC family toxin [Thermococcus barophilus]ALM75465.1 hypothetical protein TBCH5v1_1551 [Thermococcus barophilus]
MKGQIVYLDSSAIIKRYVEEEGSNIVVSEYETAYNGKKIIAFSIWNIGEVLGVFDKAKRRKIISPTEYTVLRERFLAETGRMTKLRILKIVPLKTQILVEGWKVIERHHIYQADAIQIVSAKVAKADLFLTGDKRLYEIAKEEDLKSQYLG